MPCGGDSEPKRRELGGAKSRGPHTAEVHATLAAGPHKFRTTAFQAVLGHGQDARGTSRSHGQRFSDRGSFLPWTGQRERRVSSRLTTCRESMGHEESPLVTVLL